MAEPTKKKKKLDPMILKIREDRRKRKIEKEIKRLTKSEKVLKPIEENRLPPCLFYEKEIRKRIVVLPQNVKEERNALLKEWCVISRQAALREQRTIKNIIMSQQNALKELKLESEELYNAAIQIDESLLPFSYNGPVETPPIVEYETPDGNFKDKSRDWNKE